MAMDAAPAVPPAAVPAEPAVDVGAVRASLRWPGRAPRVHRRTRHHRTRRRRTRHHRTRLANFTSSSSSWRRRIVTNFGVAQERRFPRDDVVVTSDEKERADAVGGVAEGGRNVEVHVRRTRSSERRDAPRRAPERSFVDVHFHEPKLAPGTRLAQFPQRAPRREPVRRSRKGHVHELDRSLAAVTVGQRRQHSAVEAATKKHRHPLLAAHSPAHRLRQSALQLVPSPLRPSPRSDVVVVVA
mmetsp:Transcript_12132/g.36575  ORF Transcript_12132/g.36575 Transcript_12132/m.36575 type:complete len:242 (+) Transcript_12132:882-1607(+)